MTRATANHTLPHPNPQLTQPKMAAGSGTKEPDFISDDVQTYIDIYLMSVGCLAISVCGVVANALNMAVLLRQGVKDCVSICLVSLTFSDFWTSFFVVIYSACFALSKSSLFLYIDPESLTFLSAWARSMFYNISETTTAFVSLERCLCVLMPLRFKNLITFRRALCVLATLHLMMAAAYIPSYVTSGLEARYDPSANATRLMLWVSADRQRVELVGNLVSHITVPTICLVIVLVSTQGMIIGLRRSNKFRRHKAAAQSGGNSTRGGDSTRGGVSTHPSNTASTISEAHTTTSSLSTKTTPAANRASQQKDQLSGKNKTVVKMVSILAAIFVGCNLVCLSLVYLRRAVPEIMFGQRYHNTYNTVISVIFFSGMVNASVNIFVYYHFKPGFREILLHILGCRSQEN